MIFRSFSLLLVVSLLFSPSIAWTNNNVPNNNHATKRRTILNAADSHFLPADVISRTGAPVSGITYSNYDINPTSANRSPDSSNNPTTTTATTSTEPFTARGELIDPSASLKREDIVISPPVPTTSPRVVPTTMISRGHPVDEVGVRRWRDTIAPVASYPVYAVPASTTEPVLGTTPIETPEPTPEKIVFQQAEMSRWTEAARHDEQKNLERQAEKESFQKEEMGRWTEAAKRDAHRKATKQSNKSAKASRKKNKK
jgi:hypothetical protein